MEPQDREVIDQCAKDWKTFEIYYRKTRSGEIKRYELLPVSERGDLLYCYDTVADKVKAFKQSGIIQANVIPIMPLQTRAQLEKAIGFPIELGIEGDVDTDDNQDNQEEHQQTQDVHGMQGV